ncbi:MAG: hypothetical protein A3D92_07510 [Bacteroidetes bacterium RIFCSPHIGHO2_02_FULL_44_7]|nr:MAG: hypothetical protein A3D92_07510 [Bacteroidetes bacterium RIFCSPHIGHO2_02_FULL_44_7]
MRTFQDQVVWVTGASSGIGLALVRQLDAEGAKVILSSRNREKLEHVHSTLKGTDHLILPLDLEHTSEAANWAKSVHEKYGRIDYLINNGGMSQRSEAHLTPLEIDRRMMEVNYFGNIALTKAVVPYMIAQGNGHIVVVSSIAGKFGFYLRSAYSAAKHALHGFYESLALEQEKNGIHVTIACPGKINTDISLHALNEEGKTHGQMDHNQATGMSAEQCALEMLLAVREQQREVLIGNKEIKAVTLKRFFPRLFWRIIRKQSAT